MFPTNAAIGALAVVQLGLLLLLRRPVAQWLRRRRVWKTVIGVNAVIMLPAVYLAVLTLAFSRFER